MSYSSWSCCRERASERDMNLAGAEGVSWRTGSCAHLAELILVAS